MIARLDLATIHGLREALPCLTHIPLAHLHHLSSNQRLAYWIDEISQGLAKESSIGFQWVASGETNGFIVYNDSAWDSNITGRHVGTVEQLAARGDGPQAVAILHELIEKLTRTLADRGTQCLVCKVHSNERAAIHALEQSGFLLMDTLLDFVFDFSRGSVEEINTGRKDEAVENPSGEGRGPASPNGHKRKSIRPLLRSFPRRSANAARHAHPDLRRMGALRIRRLGGLDSCRRSQWQNRRLWDLEKGFGN